jgi:hypothetical protein
MREWSLGPCDPLVLNLAADSRFCIPDYVNDHIWEIQTSGGDPPALSIHTTFGLRVRSVRVFPRFSINELTIIDPSSFDRPPSLHQFFPNYLTLHFSPVPALNVVADYWIPDSHTISGRFSLTNTGVNKIQMMLELIGQLVPLEGQGFIPQNLQSVNVLAGRCSDLAPILFFTGGPQPGPGPYPSLALKMALGPGDSRMVTWVLASLSNPVESLEWARKTAARRWEPERTRIELVNAAQTYEISTGDSDWDAALAFSQKTAFSLFMGPSLHLPHPSFVFSRQPDHGYSPRGDGADYSYPWSGQSPFEAVYLASLLPGAGDLIAGLVRNFIAIQAGNGVIDWKPGLAGQRGRWLAPPLLAILAWRTFQRTGDLDFLREVQPKLETFINCWFDRKHDRDGDGFPEWDHPLQSGLEDSECFSLLDASGQGADICAVERPGLAAILIEESNALDHIAEALDVVRDRKAMEAKACTLRAQMEECWDAAAASYSGRDRDTHLRSTGKLLGKQRGDGKLSLNKTFLHPTRLLVRFEFKGEATRKPEIRMAGENGGQTLSETLERKDFHWQTGVAVATTCQVFTRVTDIAISGLQKRDRLSVFIMDCSAEDVSQFLPLWAGIPDRARAMEIINRALLPGDRFGKPFGLPACPSDINITEATAGNQVHMIWNQLVGEGLLQYDLQEEAAQLMGRLMSAVIQNLKQNRSFFRAYNAVTGSGLGERNSIEGLAPVGLFLDTLGIRITSAHCVTLKGKNPFPWPVTVKYRGLVVTRQADQTKVVFPDGRAVTLDDPTYAEVAVD